MKPVELQIFLNNLVTDSPHLSRAQGAPASSSSFGGSRSAESRPLDNPEVVATKRSERGEGPGLGRGRESRRPRANFSKFCPN
jgi:hypothetical protein